MTRTQNAEDAAGMYEEERTRLIDTLEEVERQRSEIGPVYRGQDFVEQLLEGKREETRRRLELLGMEPYFGRLDFREQGHPEPVPLYIGKRGMDRRDTGEPFIIDWRAPVASLFYSFTGGDESVAYDAPEGTVEGEVYRKRNLQVRDRSLQRVVESYVRGGENLGLSDEFLLYRLGEKKDNRLRDIVSTIQAEQDRIIRAPRKLAMIIQGAAGSGKTTVALHRLAFLLYRYQDQVKAERMIIFAPNAMFLDYISGVLPELGVGSVRQTTFADWALGKLGNVRLAETAGEGALWFQARGNRPAIDDRTPGRIKGSLRYKDWIDAELDRFEAGFLTDQDFEAWDSRKLPAAAIREWFDVEYRHYPLAMRRERLLGRMNRWLEMQLKEIGDPKVRKERAKTGKQRLKAFEKKLPQADALAFYRALFERQADFLPEDLATRTKAYLKKGAAMPEDLPALVWIHLRFRGSEETFDHVVLDEAQDVPPFQIALLNAMMAEPSFTILGDLAQGIHAYRGIKRWEELSAVFPADRNAYHELRMSYRSTLEIIEFANRILPHTDTSLPPAQPVFRSGDPVEVAAAASAEDRIRRISAFIHENRARGMQTIAVIARTDDNCRELASILANAGTDARLIAEGQTRYGGGVTIVPVYLAKGLEFDAVLIADADAASYADDPQDAKLLYVACTRALHRLALLYEGMPSPLVAQP
ncbi:AAA family ATPase [Cohnella sp. CFH 77786]|uniref:HelD family protein n=1 Tax=Cohnella sp. CFH 77786 TaxID=2662265 RepID=UPI001C60A323|nr:3'-5' exonuclease [Cohnella sp. CFH 77786]MBW5448685.1 AAA family ATPase [Cohnella sp. CFH 77786]